MFRCPKRKQAVSRWKRGDPGVSAETAGAVAVTQQGTCSPPTIGVRPGPDPFAGRRVQLSRLATRGAVIRVRRPAHGTRGEGGPCAVTGRGDRPSAKTPPSRQRVSPIPGRKRLTPGTPKPRRDGCWRSRNRRPFHSRRRPRPSGPQMDPHPGEERRGARHTGDPPASGELGYSGRPRSFGAVRVGPNSWGEFDRSGIADWSIPNMADSLIPYQSARGESVNSDDPQMIKD